MPVEEGYNYTMMRNDFFIPCGFDIVRRERVLWFYVRYCNAEEVPLTAM